MSISDPRKGDTDRGEREQADFAGGDGNHENACHKQYPATITRQAIRLHPPITLLCSTEGLE
jgi:hypothetical protein